MFPITNSCYKPTINIPIIGGFSSPATDTCVEVVWEMGKCLSEVFSHHLNDGPRFLVVIQRYVLNRANKDS